MPADDPPDRKAGTSEAGQGSHFEPKGSKDRWHYGGGGLFSARPSRRDAEETPIGFVRRDLRAEDGVW